MDALSEVLRQVGLSGAVFCHADLSAPWALSAPRSDRLARTLRPGAPHLIEYHLLLEGEAWLRVGRGPALHLGEGDLVMLPRGDAHRISSDASGRAAAALDVAAVAQSAPGEITTRQHGGGGALTRLVCGYFALDRGLCGDLIDALPRALRVHAASGEIGFWLNTCLRLHLVEKDSERLGGALTLARLSELMFIEAVRRHVEALPAGQGGWLAALKDPPVARALALLHTRPAEPWTVDRLAAQAGVSRSALAGRFRARTGRPPMQYLARWRLTLAAQRLRDGHRSAAAVAREVGYASEAAFSRAFQRAYGAAPSARRHRPG